MIGLGQYGGGNAAYPFPNVPITLIDGTVIADPANTPATLQQCLPYQCGADSGNTGARQWCSAWGQANALVGCVDSSCVPWRAQIPGCALPTGPAPTTTPAPTPTPAPPPFVAPSITPVPAAALPPLQVLTPQNILQPLPDITAAIAPQAPACSQWQTLNGWISQNPILAIAIVVGIGILGWPKR